MSDDIIVAKEVGFNYDKDTKRFNKMGSMRLVSVTGHTQNGGLFVNLSFDLGAEVDDYITLTFDAEELTKKVNRAVLNGDNYNDE